MEKSRETRVKRASFEGLLELESAFYEKNRIELLMKFPNRFLLIYGENVCGDFPTQRHAIAEGVRKFGSKPFLVRRSGDDAPELEAPALTLGILPIKFRRTNQTIFSRLRE